MPLSGEMVEAHKCQNSRLNFWDQWRAVSRLSVIIGNGRLADVCIANTMKNRWIDEQCFLFHPHHENLAPR